MNRNYLKGTAGDKTNTFLTAAAYNMMKWMRLKQQEFLNLFLWWFYQTYSLVPVKIPSRKF
jgi:hypothetical protein